VHVSDDTEPDPDEVMSEADRELLAALGDAWGDDPLPVGIIDRADGLLTWADVDEELAELLETSSTELPGTRGASLPGTSLEFQVADGTVVIEVDLGARGRRRRGRVGTPWWRVGHGTRRRARPFFFPRSRTRCGPAAYRCRGYRSPN
jgi:hypothetical protein